MSAHAFLYDWTKPELHKACNAAYRAYYAAKTDRAKAYFAAHPELKDPGHDYKAKDIAAALPPGWTGLADLIPAGLRHRHHLSGNSSQILALALLGAAARLDPSHDWLWEAFGRLQPAKCKPPSGKPEFELNPGVLGEDHGRVTSVDYLAKDEGLVMCIECKWAEEGIGACSAPPSPVAAGRPASGNSNRTSRAVIASNFSSPHPDDVVVRRALRADGSSASATAKLSLTANRRPGG